MKTRRFLSLLLALCMLLGAAAGAFAAEPADEITYPEAVELMASLGVLAPLGGSDLGGKAGEPITWNEARSFLLGFGRNWYNENSPDVVAALPEDRAITGTEFLASFVHKILLSANRLASEDPAKHDFFPGNPDITANVYRLLSGLGMNYEALERHLLTREEACQIMMNALSHEVGPYGFTLADDLNISGQHSTDAELTDEWCRPVHRWVRKGSGEALTEWYPMSADYVGDGSITTHELLQTLGVYDFGTGNFSNNMWCNFHMIVNGNKDMDWSAGKLHWNHGAGGCEQNRISDRTGSQMEVYFLGYGNEYISDAGGSTPCRVYRVIYVDEYLAYVENQTITIYPNEPDGGTWGWSAPELPKEDGWYTINLNQKGQYTTAVNLTPARIQRSSQNGMNIPDGLDGLNYVYNEFGCFLVNSKCQVGFDIIQSMDYYHSRKNVSFLYDTKGNVIGVVDGEALSGVGRHGHRYAFCKVYLSDGSASRTESESPSVHEKWCTVCGAWSEEAHNYSRGSYQPATASRDGSVACADCGYVQTIERHSHFSDADKWLYDQDAHFHLCQFPLCRERVDVQAHSFENGVCTVCLLKEGSLETSTHIHAPAAAYEAELSGHTLPCFYPDCGFVFDKGAHTLDSHGVCTVCGFNRDLASHLPLVYAGFADVPENAWYAWAVSNVTERGLMQGLSEERFAPEGNCTRAMIWTVLARMNGETITGSQWAERARAWAVSFGVSDGENADGLITREQLVTMLYRAAGEPKASFQLDGYRDSALISAYARPAMAWALETGILSSAAEVLRPADSATRAEVAAILSRY